MTTGRENKLTGQIGEYLVAAELCRMGLIATTFTGNVPYYDIIASDYRGRHVAVQVKTSRGTSWHAKISSYCKILFRDRRQIVEKKIPSPINSLVCVFVALDKLGKDRFFICTWQQWRDLLVNEYKHYLRKHHGQRPKQWKSLHSAVDIDTLVKYEDNWRLIKNSLH